MQISAKAILVVYAAIYRIRHRIIMNFKNTIRKHILQLAVIIMLLLALNPENPYGYYIIMRVIVCAEYSYLCVLAIRAKETNWAWILGVLAFTYNPILPLHLNRGLWSVINILSILLTIIHIRKHRDSSSGE